MASPTDRAVVSDPLSQGPSCLLLDGVPREIRDMIYSFTFKGAKVIQDTSKNTFQATDQWQLLLTCRQAYDEARPIFYAETRMVFETCSSLDSIKNVSDFTKAHVKELGLVRGFKFREMLVGYFGRSHHHEHLHGPERDWLDYGAPGLLLSQFPSLQTCILPMETRLLCPWKGESMPTSEESLLAETIDYGLLGWEPWSTASFRKLGDDEWEVVCKNEKAISMLPDMSPHGLPR